MTAVAYKGSGLGNSVRGVSENFSSGRITNQDIIDFYNEHFVPKKMILGICGVSDHLEYIGLISKTFGEIKNTSNVNFLPEKSVYVGGEKRIHLDNPNTFGVGIAFESSAWGDINKSQLYFI